MTRIPTVSSHSVSAQYFRMFEKLLNSIGHSIF